jgi:carbon storage regulator
MLVLSRKVGQELVIGDNIRIVVNRVTGNRVSLGIQAPDSVHIIRSELQAAPEKLSEESEPQVHLYRVSTPIDLATKLNVVTGMTSPTSH